MSAARFPRAGVALLAASILIGVAPTGAPARPTRNDSQTFSASTKDRVRPDVAWRLPEESSTVSGVLDGSRCLVDATDNNSVAKVEFKLDGSRLQVVTAGPFTCAVDTTKISDGRHTLTATAIDGWGNRKTASRDVLVANRMPTSAPAPEPTAEPTPAPSATPTPTPTATPTEPGAAPFPSRLRASGRRIVDENGYVLPTLRGFNMHVGPGFTWSQSNFDDIAAMGAQINRAVVHWDQFEPSRGVISSTAISNLDLHVTRAEAAGIYTILELHLNVGRSPSWTADKATEMEKYAAYGQTLTKFLADRYGNPASPQYTKAVVGFGLNEPPLEDSAIRNGNTSIPYLEGKQRQMISWMRSGAPGWIGFVAFGYASATPIYDDSWQNAHAVDASPTAYDSVGGNVVVDVHDYMIGCTNTNPACDGRQWNGMSYPTYQGGPQIGTGDSPAPSYSSTELRRSQHAAFLAPYRTFSERSQIPLMIGEWGWQPASSGGLAWIADARSAWRAAGATIEIQWNYDVTTNQSVNFWAARPGGTWTSTVQSWLTSA